MCFGGSTLISKVASRYVRISNERLENCFLRHRTLLRNLSSLSLANASVHNLDDLPHFLDSGIIIGQAVDAFVQDCSRLFR